MENNKKSYTKNKFLRVIALFLLLNHIIIIVLFITGSVSIGANGFDVDSEGRLYVARLHKIEVYDKGTLVHTIDAPKFRSWVFCLDAENSILVADHSIVKELSWNGTVLASSETEANTLYNTVRNRTEFTGNDGNRYTIIGGLFQTGVKREGGTVIYQIPLIDIFASYGFVLNSIGIFIVIIFISRGRRRGQGDGFVVPDDH